ncbi:MAG: cysteine desulfurase family protein, partial [Chitinophagaceae bacterium]
EDRIDLMSFSGHKIYGPKGVGVLYMRRKNPRMRVQAQMDGGGHENGFRSGTLNVPGIVGTGMAAKICSEEMNQDAEKISSLRNQLEQALAQTGTISVNGNVTARLPNVSNLTFHKVNGQQLITEVTKKIAVSTGSACTSALPEPSHVLRAMGLTDDLGKASLRFSLGRFTTPEEVRFAAKTITNILKTL